MSEQKKFIPMVSSDTKMAEFTFRAVILGVLMAIIMGAANAYLGLKAGMTIAATYTTAVIAMAVLKLMKGTLLEENAARTIGSIGGNIATGAIFTLPAFFIAGIWVPFFTKGHYVLSTIILMVAGILGIMFVTILRRVLVEDTELPFPESIAASEIHKSGQSGAKNSKYLFAGMGLGALISALVEFKFIAAGWQKVVSLGKGSLLLRSPGMNPAYFGVGYIIGPKLGSINFSGGLLAWGLLSPLIAYFLNRDKPESVFNWAEEITFVWKNYVRYIAIGGMLVGAFYTLYKMRNSLFEGIKRSFSYMMQSSSSSQFIQRTDKDINLRWALFIIATIAVIMLFIFNHFTEKLFPAAIAVVVMMFMGFIFAAVSGYLVGIIGVSNNPTSGLTVSVLIVAAFLMVGLGMHGIAGVAAVLGVAAFTCTSVSVAGEMMQDLKAGHILGCTPWRMQLGDIFGIMGASVFMFLILTLLHLGDIKQRTVNEIKILSEQNIASVTYKGSNPDFAGKIFTLDDIRKMLPEQQNDILGTNAGFGGEKLPAPQASLMAVVAKGIVEGKTELILIIVGMFFGLSLILMQVKSPMLISVGMYLPIDTSFAIFLGGLMKGLFDQIAEKRQLTGDNRDKMNNVGVLLSSGLIAGEALLGLLFAGLAFAEVELFAAFKNPSFLFSLLAIAVIGFTLIWLPLKSKKN